MLWVTLYWLTSSIIGLLLTSYHLVLELHGYRHHLGQTDDLGVRIMAFGHIRNDSLFIVMHVMFTIVGINTMLSLARLDLAQAMASPELTWSQWVNLIAFASIPLILIVISWSAAGDRWRAARTRPPPPPIPPLPPLPPRRRWPWSRDRVP